MDGDKCAAKVHLIKGWGDNLWGGGGWKNTYVAHFGVLNPLGMKETILELIGPSLTELTKKGWIAMLRIEQVDALSLEWLQITMGYLISWTMNECGEGI